MTISDKQLDDIETAENVDDELEEEEKSGTSVVVKPWNPKDIRITTKNFTIREIYTQIQENELDLAPDFQRSFVWNLKQKILLVESILLGIPLPVFYFNQDQSGAHQVVDGVQRLTTIKYFMSDQLELKQEHLGYLSSLAGSRFSMLDPATKRRFNGTQIVAHVIEPQTPDDVKYDIFNRVNTGGSPLTAQEIRHCMSKTQSRDFLRGLVESQYFDNVMGSTFWSKDTQGNRFRNNKRMSDREMALRFCAFRTIPLKEYARASSLDGFLLEFTRQIDQQSGYIADKSDLAALKAAFEQAMRNCHAILERGAFRRWPLGTTRRGQLNRAIFESQALALADYPLDMLLPYKQVIQNQFRALFDDPAYDSAVRSATGDYRKLKCRLAMPREALARILE